MEINQKRKKNEGLEFRFKSALLCDLEQATPLSGFHFFTYLTRKLGETGL